jgi:hypothetical protein
LEQVEGSPISKPGRRVAFLCGMEGADVGFGAGEPSLPCWGAVPATWLPVAERRGTRRLCVGDSGWTS